MYNCHSIPLYLSLLPLTLERVPLMFPHINIQSTENIQTSNSMISPLKASTFFQTPPDLTRPTNSPSVTSAIKHISVTRTFISMKHFPTQQPVSNYTTTDVELHSAESTMSNSTPIKLLLPVNIQTNLSLPAGSTARLHCIVSNVEQEQVHLLSIFYI